ncbi:XAC0095 family protein [Lysobacter enzymogenes]|uniref:XAC0095 family protein n=1 Tax=Lysobacter enzymogenes TaxID=69 RepID=UPI00384C00CF
MSPKAPTTEPDCLDSPRISLPLNVYFELQAFQDQLLGAARTIHPDTSPAPSLRKAEQARHRALASVFRTWADQVERTLDTTRSA